MCSKDFFYCFHKFIIAAILGNYLINNDSVQIPALMSTTLATAYFWLILLLPIFGMILNGYVFWRLLRLAKYLSSSISVF